MSNLLNSTMMTRFCANKCLKIIRKTKNDGCDGDGGGLEDIRRLETMEKNWDDLER